MNRHTSRYAFLLGVAVDTNDITIISRPFLWVHNFHNKWKKENLQAIFASKPTRTCATLGLLAGPRRPLSQRKMRSSTARQRTTWHRASRRRVHTKGHGQSVQSRW